MTAIDPVKLISGLLWGVLWGALLGAFFFGGLWLTLRRFAARPRSRAFMLASFGLRALVVLAGLFAAYRLHPPALAGALAGFLLARLAATRLVRSGLPGGRP